MLASHPTPKPLTPLQLLACISAAAIASTVLFGWATDNASLTRILPSSIAMNPMTAVCLLAMSWAILLRSPRTAGLFYALAAAAILVGSTKLLQLALGVPDGIDQLLFGDRLASVRGAHNRMAPNTAFALAALGIGLLTSRLRDPRALIVSQIMCLVSAGTALAAVVGYLLDVVA
ncbi:MAG: two-component system, sensor histidine kinase and response regulator, partial [Sphingomonadales bacterium]|nr:two-component system, sensor histidine kinase and response regulator [Sphingomonadales bacterium]